MKSNQSGAAWPYLIILAGLFALSINAPRAWNRQRHDGQSMAELLDQRAITPAPFDGDDTLCPTSHPHESRNSIAPPTSKPAMESSAQASAVTRLPATVAEPTPKLKLEQASPVAIGPTLVKPLREFGRQVIDPIIEFAKRPTVLRTIPEATLPRFETENLAATTEPDSVWALPVTLLDALDRLAERDETMAWSTHVAILVRELHQKSGNTRPTPVILGELRDATENSSLPRLRDEMLVAEVGRARYAVARRLDVWEKVAQVGEVETSATATPANAEIRLRDEQLVKCIRDVENFTASIDNGAAWRDYLLVSQLKSLGNDSAAELDRKREIARRVIARLESQRLSQSQRKFMTNTPIAVLEQQLRPWAAESVKMSTLLRDMEKFERSQLPSDGRKLADDSRSLRWLAANDARELGQDVDLHYRNANVRISLGLPFINRFLPQPQLEWSRVNDMIAGIPVYGRSMTFTKIGLRAINDPKRIRLGLEAYGNVSSNTESDAGPATFYNRAESSFVARKLVVFGPSGLHVWPSIAEADSYFQDLEDVETNFDGIPLVGALVRNYAITQHDDAVGEVRGEVENKIAARARTQFDAQVQPRIDRVSQKFDAQLLAPLRTMGLEPTALGMSTTEERITMRMRLAGNLQVAAHTPRPRAPSDSLASLQLHQSAINNFLEKLELNGREFTVAELYSWIGSKIGQSISKPDDVPEDVTVRFAEHDAIRVRCQDGQMDLTIGIARLTHGPKKWRDFVVKTAYRPDGKALEGRFVRSGGIFLEGKSVQGKAEIVLRSIMSKALSVDRPWRVVPVDVAGDARLADLELSQMVVEDGWIGMAYAPRRVSSVTARKTR